MEGTAFAPEIPLHASLMESLQDVFRQTVRESGLREKWKMNVPVPSKCMIKCRCSVGVVESAFYDPSWLLNEK